MKLIPTKIKDLLILELQVFEDVRGYFMETWRANRYADFGIPAFVQDNLSRSVRGTLRGLHFQEPHAQGKLVQVLHGNIFDVAVDLRKNSATFGHWECIEISSENKRQFYVPPGFAHGFCVTSETVIFSYKCTDYYHPESEHCIRWNDTTLNIPWPLENPLVSAKDAKGMTWQNFLLR